MVSCYLHKNRVCAFVSNQNRFHMFFQPSDTVKKNSSKPFRKTALLIFHSRLRTTPHQMMTGSFLFILSPGYFHRNDIGILTPGLRDFPGNTVFIIHPAADPEIICLPCFLIKSYYHIGNKGSTLSKRKILCSAFRRDPEKYITRNLNFQMRHGSTTFGSRLR